MAISAFVPKIWSARFTTKLRDMLVWGSVANTQYAGEIQAAGDTVKIPTSATSITVGDYTVGTDINAAETADGSTQDLVIDKQKYFHFKVDDINAVQSRPALMDDAMQEAAYQVAKQIDDDIRAVFSPAYAAARNVEVAGALTDDSTGEDLLKAFITQKAAMTRLGLPLQDRWAIVSPEFIGAMERHFLAKPADGVFLPSTAESTLRNGFSGTLLGYRLLSTQNVATVTNKQRIFMGQGTEAVTHASQIGKVEAYRPERQFADAVKGLYVYGTKLVIGARLFFITHANA